MLLASVLPNTFSSLPSSFSPQQHPRGRRRNGRAYRAASTKYLEVVNAITLSSLYIYIYKHTCIQQRRQDSLVLPHSFFCDVFTLSGIEEKTTDSSLQKKPRLELKVLFFRLLLAVSSSCRSKARTATCNRVEEKKILYKEKIWEGSMGRGRRVFWGLVPLHHNVRLEALARPFYKYTRR